jgi:2'-5' RNA ligase
MNYAVAIFPSKKLQDKVNSYRKRYDSNYAYIPPHLTLKASFKADEASLHTIAEKLEEISKLYKPFTLKVLKTSTFQPVSNTLYFKVEQSDELAGLHNTLNEDRLFGDPSPFSFVPHITIGQNMSDDEHSDVFGQLSMLDIRHEEEIDRFHLLYQLENGVWNVYETFRLGE